MAVKKSFAVLLDIKRAVSQSERKAILVEGDTANEFVITLTDNGVAVDLTGCRVAALFSNTNGTAEQQSWGASASITIGGDDNNVITISVLSGSFASGDNRCEIQVYSGETYTDLVTSAQFNFDGRKAILNDETIVSDSAYPVLIELISQVESLGDREQSDWDETDTTLGKFIKNKPVIGTDIQAPTDALTAETTLADADAVPFYDASATAHRKSTWANIIAKIRTAFFGSVTGVAKLDGAGNVSAAAANTDFAAATHASRHASGAADAIAPSDIGAESSTLVTSTKTDNYTILASDNRAKISMNSESDKTFTFDTQAVGNYPDGMIVFLKRLGTGAVTIAGSLGVVFQSAGNRLKIAEQYAWVFVRKIATDGWEVVGSTSL